MDFKVVCELCHVWAHFKALDALIFMAPQFRLAFFYVPKLPSGTMWGHLIVIGHNTSSIPFKTAECLIYESRWY